MSKSISLNRDKDMIVWKKGWVLQNSNLQSSIYEPYTVVRPLSIGVPVVIKLAIPKDALVVLTPSMCRTSYAKVEGIYACEHKCPDDPLNVSYAMSIHDFLFKYILNEYVYPDRFDPDPKNVCSHGIHFFRTYQEARDYSG